MTVGARTSRRRFLLGACAAAVPVALAPLRPWRAIVDVAGASTPAARLAGLLSHRESARSLGRAALRALPGRPAAPELAAAVLSAVPGGAARLAALSDDEVRGALAARVRADFDEEETVQLGGWVLSRTEARLCALAALADRRTL
jgi:hypothetical protein